MADSVKNIRFKTSLEGSAFGKVKELNKEMSNLSVTAKGQLTPSISQSSMMLTDMGRIVQDLPYGIRGMGNNITFVAERMKMMQAQGISLTAQLKGMAASLLTGPGALLFGINAVVTAITIFSNTSTKTKGQIKGLTDELKGMWSETFKATQEWKDFEKEVTKLDIEQVAESLRSVREELDSSAFSFMDYISMVAGLSSTFGDAVLQSRKLIKELEILARAQGQTSKAGAVFGFAGGAGRSEEILNAEKKAREDFLKQIAKENNAIKNTIDRFTELYKSGVDFTDIILGDVSQGFYAGGRKKGEKTIASYKTTGAGMANAFVDQKQLKKQFQMVNGLIMSSADALRSEFMSAWGDIFGEANSLFEKLLANIVDQLLQLGAQQLAGSLLNFILPGAGSLLGGLFSPVRGGGAASNQPIYLQVGEQAAAQIYKIGEGYNLRYRI